MIIKQYRLISENRYKLVEKTNRNSRKKERGEMKGRKREKREREKSYFKVSNRK